MGVPVTFDVLALPELCLDPESWSWSERPIAAQSSPESGLVLTHYRDKRTVRVHRLSWANANATLRGLVLHDLKGLFGGATTARARWKTPMGDQVAVTLRSMPSVSRTNVSTGSMAIELEEALVQRFSKPRLAGKLYARGHHYAPNIAGGS